MFTGPLWKVSKLSRSLARTRPLIFCITVLVDILGYCAVKKVPINNGVIGTKDGSLPATVSDALTEFLSRFRILVTRCPMIEPFLPTYEALANGERPLLCEENDSLIRHPLRLAGDRCELPSCRAQKCTDGKLLKKCSGGCRGIAAYCCPEHQKEHWKVHKLFCKRG